MVTDSAKLKPASDEVIAQIAVYLRGQGDELMVEHLLLTSPFMAP
jgi:hypothetical protein